MDALEHYQKAEELLREGGDLRRQEAVPHLLASIAYTLGVSGPEQTAWYSWVSSQERQLRT